MFNVRRVLSGFCAALWLTLCSSVLAASPEAGKALHLLSYIGADYPATVENGEVIDAGEYAEQVEFLAVLDGLLAQLPTQPESPALIAGVAQLKTMIDQRQEGAEVSVLARKLAGQVAQLYGVEQTPEVTPDATRGAPLYAAQCAVCHGDSGRGDGLAAEGMEPPPANLTNAARLDQMSLYDIYNTLGLGVEGTDMPSFAELLSERERWDLASYVASLSAPTGEQGEPLEVVEWATLSPQEASAERGEGFANQVRLQRAAPPAPVLKGAAPMIQHTLSMLQQSFEHYQKGERDAAYDLSVAAYLEGFEQVESSLDNLNRDLRKSTEASLMRYRQALQDGLPVEEAQARLQAAQVSLGEAQDLLDGGEFSGALSFISSLLILLREGVEAILVLAAILAYLKATQQHHAVRSVHAGWLLALVAGVATWALANYVIQVSGAQREVIEGATAVFASIVLLWMGVWMHDRKHAMARQASLQSSLVSTTGRWGLAVLAFFSVYRELFEVILFYETLWLQVGEQGHQPVIAGAVTALVILVGLAWVILKGSRKLPLGTFFGANAVLLCVLSVVFAGHGVAALQEAGVIHTMPTTFIRLDWLGIFPDLYTLGAQVLALLGIALLFWRSSLRRKA